MDFVDVYQRYKSDLDAVDETLLQSVQSQNSGLTESSTQLVLAGGKRLRPLFALICSQIGPTRDIEQLYWLGAALEMVHMATLVHDDVIDDSDMRRGRPTVRAQFGNRPAMYTGDFLFARAIWMFTKIGDPRVHQTMSAAMVEMCQGEIEQIRDFYRWNQSLKVYLRRVKRKTALLISVSCSLGALVAGAPPEVFKSLGKFGYHAGMAFQIIDDVLDYVGDEAVVGKRVGSDLFQGNMTLPALYGTSCGPHAKHLQELIHPNMSPQDTRLAISLIRESGGVDVARNLARTYLDRAIRDLDGLTLTQVREELSVLARFLNQRMF
ncbi:hypothetical protein D2Q93_05915 [Alicyclobacillaceae bacterium I2511]|nr:hypothetical protein D2Q93_05915 [Alicyclobacillaceae bacterium I2511]